MANKLAGTRRREGMERENKRDRREGDSEWERGTGRGTWRGRESENGRKGETMWKESYLKMLILISLNDYSITFQAIIDSLCHLSKVVTLRLCRGTHTVMKFLEEWGEGRTSCFKKQACVYACEKERKWTVSCHLYEIIYKNNVTIFSNLQKYWG